MSYVERTDEEIIVAVCEVMKKCRPDYIVDVIDGTPFSGKNIVSGFELGYVGLKARIVDGLRTIALRDNIDPFSMISDYEKKLKEHGYLLDSADGPTSTFDGSDG